MRGRLEGKTGACGRTVTTASRSLMPYDSAASKSEAPEEEIGRSELSFTARLNRPTPSELFWFLLSFCTRHKVERSIKAVYGRALDVLYIKRLKVIVSIECCSDLQRDSTMAGPQLRARMILQHGFE